MELYILIGIALFAVAFVRRFRAASDPMDIDDEVLSVALQTPPQFIHSRFCAASDPMEIDEAELQIPLQPPSSSDDFILEDYVQ